ncbi:hypothetical protein ACO22_05026 [Paracoccidioides brasiliensis]|uniref:Uncharacterized protein n=1 Tax=Paracoccidioides brasiliensis TaxID=121759 RepID=A0A1D2JBC7_PARBR|nr:hypothetical protein ACO22_05026 [Paracoccidioides brasiliensis]
MAISDSESFCNDGTEESWIILTGLPCLFREQFPKMPKDHIARLIFDRHRQNASGGYWRNLISRQKDTGRISWPINFKDYVKASSPEMHIFQPTPVITPRLFFRSKVFPERSLLTRLSKRAISRIAKEGRSCKRSMLPRKLPHLETGPYASQAEETIRAKISSPRKSHTIHQSPLQRMTARCHSNRSTLHPCDPDNGLVSRHVYIHHENHAADLHLSELRHFLYQIHNHKQALALPQSCQQGRSPGFTMRSSCSDQEKLHRQTQDILGFFVPLGTK